MYLLLFCLLTVTAADFETATQAVKNMKVGWNLGNTLDAHGQTVHDPSLSTYWGQQGLDSETYWGQPKATASLFKMFQEAGFGAIRVPVTWYNHMDANGKVDEKWMARVKEVVDYVISNGMYCIINVHHDTGADGDDGSQHWLKASTSRYNSYKTRYEYLWQQIATTFKDYDEKLLFESYNEMLDEYSSWCFASYATSGRYDAAVAADAYSAINSYAQSFVNVVRNTGGNNAQRNLVVNTYGACNGDGTWNSHLKDPLKEMKLPQDQVQNHLIFEVHTYPSLVNNGANRSLSDIKNEVNDFVSALKQHLVSKGAPVIFGEWGTYNVDSEAGKRDYDVRRSLLFQFVEYFIQKTKSEDMGTFFWMGLSDGQARSMPVFTQADLAECLIKAWYGSADGYKFPVPDGAQILNILSEEKALAWGNGFTINASTVSVFDKTVTLRLTFVVTGSDDDIQLYYGDWSEKPSFYVNGKSFNADYNPTRNGAKLNEEFTVDITFSESVYNILCKKGLIVHGNNVTIKKALLMSASSAANILSVGCKGIATNETLYNLQGQRVSVPQRGIYIRNGKKYIYQ